MVSSFSKWKKFDLTRQEQAKVCQLALLFSIHFHILSCFACTHEVFIFLTSLFVLFQAQLERIVKADGISDNVYEIASKSLVA